MSFFEKAWYFKISHFAIDADGGLKINQKHMFPVQYSYLIHQPIWSWHLQHANHFSLWWSFPLANQSPKSSAPKNDPKWQLEAEETGTESLLDCSVSLFLLSFLLFSAALHSKENLTSSILTMVAAKATLAVLLALTEDGGDCDDGDERCRSAHSVSHQFQLSLVIS